MPVNPMLKARKIVYRAEDSFKAGDRLPDMAAARAYVTSVVESDFWKNTVPGVPRVAVASTKTTKFASAGYNTAVIYLPQWAWQEYIILHELAHVLVTARHGCGHDHDGFFVYWLGRLVDAFLGAEVLQRFVESFLSHGVNPWAAKSLCENGNYRRTLVAPVKKEVGPVWLTQSQDNVAGHTPLSIVVAAVKKQGKSISSLVSAMGGDKGVKPPKAEYWRPRYMGKTRWLPTECLEHIDELGDKRS